MNSMVVQTGVLHHHIDEKVGHDRCDEEKREIQFPISPVAEFKDLIKQTDGNGKKQDEPGPPGWQNDIGRDSEKVGKRHQEQSQEERQDKKQKRGELKGCSSWVFCNCFDPEESVNEKWDSPEKREFDDKYVDHQRQDGF